MTVEKMSLDFSKIREKMVNVDGRFKIKQTQYMIFIDAHGLANHLNVVFSSETYSWFCL